MPKSPPKPIIQSFLQDWNGRQSWAEQNKVPYPDFIQTVRYDYNRMINTGYKMNDTEAFDALSSLASGKNPFTTPTTNPPSITNGPFGWFGAIRNDIQGIVTGVFHIPQALATDVTEATHGNFNGLAQLIPGYMDIHNLLSPSGRQWMLQHPVSDILDLGGLSSETVDVLDEAGVATGARAARGGIGGLLYKAGAKDAGVLVSRIPSHPFSRGAKLAFNEAADRIATIDKIRSQGIRYAGQFGLLEHQRQLFRVVSAMRNIVGKASIDDLFNPQFWDRVISQYPEGRPVLEMLFGDSPTSVARLVTPDEMARVREMYNTGADTLSGIKSQPLLRSSESIPANIRQAYSQLADMQIGLQNWEIKSGNLVPVLNPITHDEAWVNPTNQIIPFIKRWQRDIEKRAKTGDEFSLAVKTVNDGLQQITARDDPAIPADLRAPEDKVTTTVTALKRIANKFAANPTHYFKYPEVGPTTRLASALQGFTRRMKTVFGADGKVNQLTTKLESVRDITTDPAVLKQIDSIRRSVNRLNIAPDEDYAYLRDTLVSLRTQIKAMQSAQSKMSLLSKAAKDAETVASRTSRLMELKWNRYAEREFAPMVTAKMHELATNFVRDHYTAGETTERLLASGKVITATPETVVKAQEDIASYHYSSPEVKAIFTPADWARIKRESYEFISELKAQGYDPLVVQAVRPTEVAGILRPSPGVRVASFVHRSVEHALTDPASDSMFDPLLGIAKETQDIYKQAITEAIITRFVRQLGKTKEELLADSKMFNWHAGDQNHFADMTDVQKAENYAMRNGYRAFDPRLIPELTSSRWNFGTSETVYLKDYDHELIAKTFQSTFKNFDGARDKAMGIYRIGVLYASPRYFAHITLGGATMTLLQVNPIDVFRFFPRAMRMGKAITKGDFRSADIPPYMSTGVNEADLYGHIVSHPVPFSLEQSGRKLAVLWQQGWIKKMGGDKIAGMFAAYQNFLETISNTYRSVAYLSGKARFNPLDASEADRAAAKAWNTPLNEWMGAKLANKVLADRMAQSPLDRAIIRNIMPFWGWTKHILRYMMTYPKDHPLAASIIQAVANEALGEGNQQLPDYLFRLLFIGQPDVTGNVTVLDTRQWNPFRDTANYMSLAGWTSQLAPWFAGGLSALHIDPVTGGTELYPSLTYDSFYGGTAETGGNLFTSTLEQFSPQIDTLISVAQKTSVLRQEAQANPGKLGYLIADSLGVPWIPYKLNTKNVIIQGTKDEEQLASAAVQQALLTNSMEPLNGYNGLLPLSDYQVNKDYIASIIKATEAYNRQNGTNLPATDLLALPYAIPYAPAYLEQSSVTSTAPGVA